MLLTKPPNAELVVLVLPAKFLVVLNKSGPSQYFFKGD